MAKNQKFQFRSIGRYIFRQHLPMETETTLFVLVSILDIFMTWKLITITIAGGGGFVESNPVAKYFLDRWGGNGLVAFKFTAVLVVCLSTQLIAIKKPRLALFILNAGTAVVAIVVIYSLSLYLKAGNGSLLGFL